MCCRVQDYYTDQWTDATQRRHTYCYDPVVEDLDQQADVASFESKLLFSLGIIKPVMHVQGENDSQEGCNDRSNSQKGPLTDKRPW